MGQQQVESIKPLPKKAWEGLPEWGYIQSHKFGEWQHMWRLTYISLSPFFLVAFPLLFRDLEMAREMGEEESESLQADMVGGRNQGA